MFRKADFTFGGGASLKTGKSALLTAWL